MQEGLPFRSADRWDWAAARAPDTGNVPVSSMDIRRLEVPFPDAIGKTLLIQQTEFFPVPKVRITAFGTMSHGSAKPGKPTQRVIPSTGCGAFALFKNSTVTKESVSVPIFCRSCTISSPAPKVK